MKNNPILLIPISIVITAILAFFKLVGKLHISWWNVCFPLEAVAYLVFIVLIINPKKNR